MDYIRQLWYGNLRPMNDSGLKNEKMQELERLMGRNLEALERRLDEQEKEQLSRYIGNADEYLLEYGEQGFYHGFCLGVTLVAQAMSKQVEE